MRRCVWPQSSHAWEKQLSGGSGEKNGIAKGTVLQTAPIMCCNHPTIAVELKQSINLLDVDRELTDSTFEQ